MCHAADIIARHFHETYERLAPEFGYETRQESRTDWSKVPPENKALMVAVTQELLDKGLISCGEQAVW